MVQKNLNLLLKALLEADLEFVLIGGYAAVVHGSSQVTRDLDLCALRRCRLYQLGDWCRIV